MDPYNPSNYPRITADLQRVGWCTCNFCVGLFAARAAGSELANAEPLQPGDWSWRLCGMPANDWSKRVGPCPSCPDYAAPSRAASGQTGKKRSALETLVGMLD